MNPKGLFAVVTRSHYSSDRTSPSRWIIMPVGRETAKRVYHHAVSPGRWQDTHEAKDRVIARFDTHEEARGFILTARTMWDSHAEEIKRVETEVEVAHANLTTAINDRASRLARWINEAANA